MRVGSMFRRYDEHRDSKQYSCFTGISGDYFSRFAFATEITTVGQDSPSVSRDTRSWLWSRLQTSIALSPTAIQVNVKANGQESMEAEMAPSIPRCTVAKGSIPVARHFFSIDVKVQDAFQKKYIEWIYCKDQSFLATKHFQQLQTTNQWWTTVTCVL